MAKALRVSFRPKPEPTPSWSASARARTVASSLRRVSSWPAAVSAAWSALAFLYQHLYAAACLLNSGQTGAISVAVERDEDIEQVTSAGRTYIQVKTRGQAIMPADIKSALERFDALRQEHAQSTKPGRATFVVVVNRALGPTLADQVWTGQLAGDVEILYPGRVWPSLQHRSKLCQTLLLQERRHHSKPPSLCQTLFRGGRSEKFVSR